MYDRMRSSVNVNSRISELFANATLAGARQSNTKTLSSGISSYITALFTGLFTETAIKCLSVSTVESRTNKVRTKCKLPIAVIDNHMTGDATARNGVGFNKEWKSMGE